MIIKRFIAILMAFLITFSFMPVISSAAFELTPVLTILHTNDVHGHFEASDHSIGHDLIAGVFERIKAERDGAVMLLDAGDAIQGLYFTGQSKGRAAIEIMNAAGYDAMVMGNHEFDYGWNRLRELAQLAEFPFLLQDSVSEGSSGFAAYKIFERGGLRIGVFGLTSPSAALSSSGGFGKDFGDEESLIVYAQEITDKLRAEGVNIVVCLAHLGVEDYGFGTSYMIRDNVTGIDVIIDGRSHTPLEEIEQIEGKAHITSTGTKANALGIVEIYAAGLGFITTTGTISKSDVSETRPKRDVTELIRRWSTAVEREGTRIAALLPFDIQTSRADECTRETIIGNITTDAVRLVSGADIALINGGSIHDLSLKTGYITRSQLVAIFPLGNTIHKAEVKGSVILEALEHGVSRYPEADSAFAHVSGLSFNFNPLAPAGTRVSGVRVGSEELNTDRTYTLATSDFLAAGGDGYEMLTTYFHKQLPLKESGMSALDEVLIWYFERYQSGLSDELDGRINAKWLFSDLNEEENDVVNELAVRGIILGYPDGTFRAGETLKRSQIAVILARYLDLPVTDTQVRFSDMTGNEWYAGHVQACYNAGLIRGFPDGTFRSDEDLTIGQLNYLIERISDPGAVFFEIQIVAARMDAAYAIYNLLYPPDVS